MTFTDNNLSLLFPGGGGFNQLWQYTTTDTLATVNSSGYFDDKANELKIGDTIRVVVVDDVDENDRASVTTVADVVVLSNTGTVVDVSDGVPIYGTAGQAASNKIILQGEIDDISSADQVYLPCPFAGAVSAVYTALHGAITGSDATLTVKTAAGTVGTITVANSGSAAGDVDSLTSGLNNTAVAAGETVEIETDGGSTNAVKLTVTVVIDITQDAD